MTIKILDAKEDKNILERIYKYEESIFQEAAIGRYNIGPFTRYGRCYAIFNEKDIISVIEVIFSLDRVAYIYGVSTNENYRHKGYASKLLEYCINDLIKENIKYIELNVTDNNDLALKLYKKFNFYVKENLGDEFFDGHTKLLMRKDI